MSKRNCNHPKRKVASYMDEKTNTYYEKCIRCGKRIYIRKFPRVKGE